MRILIVHHPGAGRGEPSREAMVAAFQRAGHRVDYASAEARDWKAVIDPGFDLVVAAGGDGTARRVAIAVAELPGSRPPVTVLALGTANNIARSLELTGSLEELVAGLESATERRLAIGIARAPWGERRFVESVGLGIVARLIRETPSRRPPPELRPDPEVELRAAVALLQRMLASSDRRPIRLTADGVDLPAWYLLLEVMNTVSVGPGLHLAPWADPSADSFRLVLAGEAERDLLESYLALHDGTEPLPAPIPSRVVRTVTLEWPGDDGHLDDQGWPDESEPREGGRVDVSIDSTVAVLVPKRAAVG